MDTGSCKRTREVQKRVAVDERKGKSFKMSVSIGDIIGTITIVDDSTATLDGVAKTVVDVSQKIEKNLDKSVKSAATSLDKLKVETGQTGAKLKQLGDTAKKTGQDVSASSDIIDDAALKLKSYIAGFVGLQGVIALTKQTVAAIGESQTAIAILEARIKSTSGVAGRTAEELVRFADTLSETIKRDDEEIILAVAELMKFTDVAGEQFERIIQLAADMAGPTGDLIAEVEKLGKAAQEPDEALTLLQRSVGRFSDAEEEAIKKLAQSGKEAEAASLMFDILERRVGGTAKAYAETLGGALGGIKISFENQLELLEEGLSPAIQDLTEDFDKWLRSEEGQRRMVQLGHDLGRVLRTAAEAASDLSPSLDEIDESNLVRVLGAVVDLVGLIAKLKRGIEDLLGPWKELFLINPLTGPLDWLGELIKLFDTAKEKAKDLRKELPAVDSLGLATLPGFGLAGDGTPKPPPKPKPPTGGDKPDESAKRLAQALAQLRREIEQTTAQQEELTRAFAAGFSQEQIRAIELRHEIENAYLQDVERFGTVAANALRKLREEQLSAEELKKKAEEIKTLVDRVREMVLEPLPESGNGILDAFARLMEDQQAALEEINGEHNRQARAISAVNALLAEGLITEEQRNEYMRQYSDMWEVLPAEITVAQQLILNMQDTLVSAALAGSTALADGLVEAAFEGKEAWDDLGESLESILKRLIADWLAQWFQAMAQWLARWIATQAAAKATSAALGNSGGGGTNAATSAGIAAAGKGVSSYLGYWMIPVAIGLMAIYKGFIDKSDEQWAQVNLKTGKGEGESRKVADTVRRRANELIQEINEIAKILDLDLQELGDVSLGKRGKSYYVQIGDSIQEGFATVEEALDYARVQAIKWGTLGDQISENVRTAINNSLARTMEEFQFDIDFAKRIDTIKLGEVGAQILEIFRLRTEEIEHARRLGLSITELIEARKQEFDAIRNSLLGINTSVVDYLKDLFSYQKGAEEAYSKLRSTFERILGTSIEEAEALVKEYGDLLSTLTFVPATGRPRDEDYVPAQWLDAAGNAVDETTRNILTKVDRFKKALEKYYEQLAALPEKLTEDQIRLGIFDQLFGFIEGNARLAAKYEKERAAFAKLQVDIQFKLIKLWLEAFGVFEEFAALFNDAYQSALQAAAGRPPGRSGGGGGTDRKEIREDLLRQIKEIEAELKGPLHVAFLQFARALADFKEEAKKGKLSAEDLARGIAALTAQFQRNIRDQANALAGIGTDFTRRLDNVKKFFDELRDLGRSKTGMPKWLVDLLEGKALDVLGKELDQAIAAFGGLSDPMLAITIQADVLRQNVLAFAKAAGWSSEQIAEAMAAIDRGVDFQRQQGINSALDRLFAWAKQAGILAKESLEHERTKALLDLTVIEAQLRFFGALTAEIEGWISGIRDWINSPAFGNDNPNDVQNVRVVNSDNDWDEIVEKIKSLVDDWRQAVQQFADSTASLMTDDNLTNLTQEEQLAFAKAQVEDLTAKALAGDAEALAKLDAARAEYLRELRESEAAGFGFDTGWDWVMGLTAEVLQNAQAAEDAMIANELAKNIDAWSYVMGQLALQLEAAFYSNTQDLIAAIYDAIGGVPGLASGGIVMRGPRLVRVAEQVAEAIVPLDRLMEAVPFGVQKQLWGGDEAGRLSAASVSPAAASVSVYDQSERFRQFQRQNDSTMRLLKIEESSRATAVAMSKLQQDMNAVRRKMT